MATDAVTYRWYLDGTWIETTPTPSVELVALMPGAHSVDVTAVDDSGNESGHSTPYTFSVVGVFGAKDLLLLGVG